MSYTPEQKQQIVAALKKAKEFLQGRDLDPMREKYICISLMHIRRLYPDLRAGAYLAEEIVQSRVKASACGYSTIESYLKQITGIEISQLNMCDVQEFRHRWVDHLIEEFSQ